jgi:ATP-dependent helicase/nuclease subunit A
VKDFLGKESFTLEAMPAQVRVHELFDDLATRFSARFQDRKLRSGVLEIADLEPLSERVIVDHPELARAFAQDWDFWLIDEYQDTSPAQVRLLTALIGEKPAFIVGDPQQSIYSFRGARSEVFEVKWQQEVERGSATDVLMDNYRTQAPLMHFINDLLSGAKGRFAPMSPKKSISPEAFPPASLYPCDDAEGAEPCWPGAVTTHLRRLVEAGASLGQVVILGRERKHLEEVASVLRRWGWPCHVHAAGGYGDRREIADLVALVRLMIHAEDNRNLIALLRSPWFRVEDESIKAAIHAMDTGAFWDRLIASSDLHEHPSLRILIRMRTDARAIGVSAALVRCLDESGWLDDALRFDPTGRMESNVWKFLAQLRQFERSGQTNFLGFLETQGTRAHVEESDDTQDAVSSVEPNRIQLMTVHGAKGLEFDHVLSIHIDREPRGGSNRRKIWVDEQGQRYTIPAAVDEDESRSFPVTGLLLSREEQRRQRAEGERVFYVAATRARKTWALFWDDSRMGKGATAFLQGWDLTAGTHIDPLYTYHVDRGPFAPTAFDGGRAADADVVRPWTPSGAIPEGRRRKSVSQILEEQAEPAAVAGTGSGTGKEWATIQAAAKGIEFHRLMESIKYAPASARDGWTGSMRQAVDWCLQLQDPPLARIIEAGEVEWGFQYLQEDLIVEGQIDLWGVVDGVTYVVDYKTGSPDLNKAFRQLHLYAEALVRLDRSRKIRLVVLQPFRQKVNCVWPSELVSVNFALRSAADDGTGKLTR